MSVRTARATAERCIDRLRGGDTSGCTYVALILLATACAMSGDAPAPRAAALEMDRERHPAYTVIEPDRILSWAWVEASEGAISVAIGPARSAAAFAAERGHWGSEAYALAVVAGFGDSSTAPRLRELRSVVDGPRVRAAAQQAAGLATADSDQLIAAACRFEDMGDLASAADAAAQAATHYQREGGRAAYHAATSKARRLQEAGQGAGREIRR